MPIVKSGGLMQLLKLAPGANAQHQLCLCAVVANLAVNGAHTLVAYVHILYTTSQQTAPDPLLRANAALVPNAALCRTLLCGRRRAGLASVPALPFAQHCRDPPHVLFSPSLHIFFYPVTRHRARR